MIEQMRLQFPKRKREILPPATHQFKHPRATIDLEELRKQTSSLKYRVAPGLGALRNEHLTSLLFNDHENASPKAKAVIHKLYDLANNIV